MFHPELRALWLWQVLLDYSLFEQLVLGNSEDV